MITRLRRIPALALAAVLAPAGAPAQATVPARAEYAAVAAALEPMIEREMERKGIPAISIALVDDQEIVWARGFGLQSPKDSTPASAETVYRVGSVSKLFTDLAVMQLVERGELDLDAPVTRYLPGFAPRSAGLGRITLRQLMAHRSGLVREPPVGHYFDSAGPSLAATVASLNRTSLVHAPATRTKYSNAGIAVVGAVLERTKGEPFAGYVQGAVLRPLGLTRSAFVPEPALTKDLAAATMRTLHGRTFDAPTFQLGMAPAGSMYATVTDLGRFLSALFAARLPQTGGLPAGPRRGTAERPISRAMLDTMWTPQFAPPGATAGFGLGFNVSSLDGRRAAGHGGAIYGFATELTALPDDRIGAVVVATLDVANGVTEHIATTALRAMLAARAGQPLPRVAVTDSVGTPRARRLAGRYAKGDRALELSELGGRLYLTPLRGGVRQELRALGADTLMVDDLLSIGARVIPLGERAIVIGADTFARVPNVKPVPVPARLAGLVGEYGWDYNTLYILERDGRLHALIEWFFEYPLEEASPNVFRFPDRGLYDNETLVFTRDSAGRGTRVMLNAIAFARRQVGPEQGEQLTITPLRPIPELRAEALAAAPPREEGEFRPPELVDLATLDPAIRFDIRYATTNNFLGAVFYSQPRVFLQRPAAAALLRAHRALRERGYGLLVHDGYRPWYVTRMFWDATPPEHRWLVADPARGSRHNRGAAVDLTLYELSTGKPVEMPGTYDELSDRSYPGYPGGTALQRWHRELLRQVMESEGFTVYPAEWWHFDHDEWRRYPLGNEPFEKIRR